MLKPESCWPIVFPKNFREEPRGDSSKHWAVHNSITCSESSTMSPLVFGQTCGRLNYSLAWVAWVLQCQTYQHFLWPALALKRAKFKVKVREREREREKLMDGKNKDFENLEAQKALPVLLGASFRSKPTKRPLPATGIRVPLLDLFGSWRDQNKRPPSSTWQQQQQQL